MNNFAETTDDLTPNQFQQLLTWLWSQKQAPTNRAVREWRNLNKLPE